jgi:hypothetical protein
VGSIFQTTAHNERALAPSWRRLLTVGASRVCGLLREPAGRLSSNLSDWRPPSNVAGASSALCTMIVADTRAWPAARRPPALSSRPTDRVVRGPVADRPPAQVRRALRWARVTRAADGAQYRRRRPIGRPISLAALVVGGRGGGLADQPASAADAAGSTDRQTHTGDGGGSRDSRGYNLVKNQKVAAPAPVGGPRLSSRPAGYASRARSRMSARPKAATGNGAASTRLDDSWRPGGGTGRT